MSTLERFFKYVEKSHDPDGCWLWIGGKIPDGYGMFRANKKHYVAHRFAYEHFVGDIPSGLYVCHACDVRACVNPAHLWLGTHGDNMRDMVEKGRTLAICGEKNGFARLTAEAVRDIRARYLQGGITQQSLADEYGVSLTAVWYAINRLTWKHVE